MMQILKAGGMEVLTDGVRNADINNPRGYFEYEKVKSLQTDNSWLAEAENKVLKVITQLVHYLPLNFNYYVIVMKRKIDEIILSQNKMIDNLGSKKTQVDNNTLKNVFQNQLNKSVDYLSSNKSFNVFVVDYNELLSGNSKLIVDLNTELNLNLDTEKALRVINPALYRNRN